MHRQEILRDFITLWNQKDIDGLAKYMSEDAELRSTNVLRFFPESLGLLNGRQEVLDYFKVVLQKIPNFVVEFESVMQTDDSIIVNSKTTDGLLDFHVQYYFDHENKIFLIKSDLSEKF